MQLIIETAVFLGVYPTEEKKVTNYLYEYLQKYSLLNILDSASLLPYSVKVQSPERTFVDKVFALADYYLEKRYEEHSRHIYDLYKLEEIVSLDSNLKKLISKVRSERKKHKTCYSAKDDMDINKLLTEIIECGTFAEDYNNRTFYLLFNDKVPYEEAVMVLNRIVESNVFKID